MSLIPDERKELLKKEFTEKMEKPVRILMFTQELECKFCSETRQLAQELATLSDKIIVEVYDFVANADRAKEYRIDKIPALAVVGEKDYGVRFYGFPYGYELQTLTSAVLNVSKGRTDISDKTKEVFRDVKVPVHIQVFVTLTCPYCAIVASIAHKFAIENEFIRADVIDANEFSYLAQKYSIIGVPKTVINEKIEFVGPLNEDLFAEHVLLATY
jgi:glutaredoxin-like protein